MRELSDDQIREMVNRYFRNYLEGLEILRVEAGPFGDDHTLGTVHKIIQSVSKGAKEALAACYYFDYWSLFNN